MVSKIVIVQIKFVQWKENLIPYKTYLDCHIINLFLLIRLSETCSSIPIRYLTC